MTKQVVGIVSYKNAGNLHSVFTALESVSNHVKLVSKPEEMKDVDKLVLPGVGTYNEAIKELRENNFFDQLISYDKPLLGICVGMQVMSTLGYENGLSEGLSLVEGEVKPIISQHKVPHVGFNTIQVTNKSTLLKGLNNREFYFMHSYEFVNYQNIIALTTYEGHKFVSAIEKDNIFGVQFHPEKGRNNGIKVLENFMKI